MRQQLVTVGNGTSTGNMMFGANVTLADWWLWNQVLVVLGNLGGFVFTRLAVHATYKSASASNAAPLPMQTRVPAE